MGSHGQNKASTSHRAMVWLVVLLAAGVSAVFGWQLVEIQAGKALRGAPPEIRDRGFESSNTCRSCHPAEYASWHRTYHRTMTQVASPQSVLAPFDDVKLASRGRSYALMRRGDEFWVRMADPVWEVAQLRNGVALDRITDPPLIEARIVMTTGSHQMQGYWILVDGGVLRKFPWYYLIGDKRWVPREDVFVMRPNVRHLRVWNANCIGCHSVGGAPGFDHKLRTHDTKVAELGIACEACHGPAEAHVRRYQNPLIRYLAHLGLVDKDDRIVNPSTLSAERSVEVCGQCHGVTEPLDQATWMVDGFSYRPGDDLSKTRHVFDIDSLNNQSDPTVNADYYWADGSMRVIGREMQPVVDSPCFKGGELSCSSCHSMHRGDPNQMLDPDKDSDQMCLACHEAYGERPEQHTHHDRDSSGARCLNCHMPRTAYGLFRAMRAHRVDSPTVAMSATSGRPNACNLCHLDQTLSWTGEHLESWFGQSAPELSEEDRTEPASLRWLLSGNVAQRIVTVWHFGWLPAQAVSGTEWMPRYVAELLLDPYAAVRRVAEVALRSFADYRDVTVDFLGSPEERELQRGQILARWAKQTGWGAPAPLPAGRSTLSEERVRDLIDSRDNTPYQMPE